MTVKKGRRSVGTPGDRPLSGRAALITGGGRNIGRAISLGLARAGANVMVNYLSRRTPAAETAGQIEALGVKSEIVQADVSTPRGAARAAEATVRKFGRLDILVNNVGDFLYKPLLDVKPDEWRHIIQNNLDTVFLCSLCSLPHMKKRKWGRIINIGVAGCDTVRAFSNNTAYNVAKTGVLILSKSLAKEVAGFGITVNVVAPGLVEIEPGARGAARRTSARTGKGATARRGLDAFGGGSGAVSRRQFRRFEKQVPAGRAATLVEIAEAVLFLASEESRYVTGSCITVSGGWLV
ncbi:MAG: SDR family oxidoreductase [Candidatus Eisenbacteria bacterium]